jgi:ubiquitin-activating enzyme E1
MLYNRSVFNDFGPKFTCVDPTGEQPLTGMIVSVDKVIPSCYFEYDMN